MTKLSQISHERVVRALKRAWFYILREGKHISMTDDKHIVIIPRQFMREMGGASYIATKFFFGTLLQEITELTGRRREPMASGDFLSDNSASDMRGNAILWSS